MAHIKKGTVTLADLLEQHNAPRTIHYLCLDVEGAEQTILEPFDFDGKWNILAISVEGSRCDELPCGASTSACRIPSSLAGSTTTSSARS